MKTKIIKSDNTLKVNEVTLREPLAEDVLEAQKYSSEGEAAVTLALMAQISTFDGKRLTIEELKKLSMTDFLALSTTLAGTGWMGLEKQ